MDSIKAFRRPILFFQDSNGYKEEIYAYGLRNPWRFSFDPKTRYLWCGDVGQDSWEEIDLIQNRGNFGWRCYESFHPYDQSACSGNNYVFPVIEYGHTSGNCCIIGGFVYSGKRTPELNGRYIYGDYCTGNIWQFQLSDSSNSSIGTIPTQLYSFGEDINGELYFSGTDNNIYEFTPAVAAPSNLNIALTDSGKINLTWTNNSTNATGFIIQRKSSNNIFSQIGTTLVNRTFFCRYCYKHG